MATPLIAGGGATAARETTCALYLLRALLAGALAPTAGGVVVGEGLRSVLATLLHVRPDRVGSLASGNTGGNLPSSAPFMAAYAAARGFIYAQQSRIAASAVHAANAVAAFAAYVAQCGAALPAGHLALVA